MCSTLAPHGDDRGHQRRTYVRTLRGVVHMVAQTWCMEHIGHKVESRVRIPKVLRTQLQSPISIKHAIIVVRSLITREPRNPCSNHDRIQTYGPA